MEPRLVCLIGAECTGKTSLAQALSTRTGGLWVPEYLRTFTQRQGRTPGPHEQAGIVQEQVRQESQTLAVARALHAVWVFCDTAPLLSAIYSDLVFGDVSLYPQARTLHARYALTLLLAPDIPWVADGLQRDGEHARTAVHAMLERELQATAVPYVPISGNAALRQLAAMDALLALRP